MIGLNKLDKLNHHILYTSAISKVFVQSKYPQLNVEVLEIGFAKHIKISDKVEFSVTALPSGHCPGSLMFLFELSDNTRVLYTGDFRISKKDLNQLTVFKEPIDSIYLDSTFFYEEYSQFPTQSQSIKKIIELTRKFISQGKDIKVCLQFPARIGYEYLIKQLFKHFQMKIHVKEELYEEYRTISNLGKMTSCTNFVSSQIHVIPSRFFKSSPYYDKYKIKIIKPSAMIWRNWKLGDPISCDENELLTRVCYSNHSSFEEIRDLILLAKPKKIYLNVMPENECERRRFLKNVEEIQKIYQKPNEIVDEKPQIDFKRLRRCLKHSEDSGISEKQESTSNLKTLDSGALTAKKFKKFCDMN